MENRNARQIENENSPKGKANFYIFTNLESLFPPIHMEGSQL
jgi:hypothetical protein